MKKISTGILLLLSLAACSSTDGAAAIPVTVTATAPAIEVTSKETIEVTTTAFSTVTELESTTLTPRPAGTITLPAETIIKTVKKTAIETITAEPAGPASAFEDGSFIVGKDIEIGTYQANGDAEDCYWARKDQLGEIIDNNFGTVMTVQDGDFLIETTRCGSWVKVA